MNEETIEKLEESRKGSRLDELFLGMMIIPAAFGVAFIMASAALYCYFYLIDAGVDRVHVLIGVPFIVFSIGYTGYMYRRWGNG